MCGGFKNLAAMAAAHPALRYFELVGDDFEQGAAGGAAGNELHR